MQGSASLHHNDRAWGPVSDLLVRARLAGRQALSVGRRRRAPGCCETGRRSPGPRGPRRGWPHTEVSPSLTRSLPPGHPASTQRVGQPERACGEPDLRRNRRVCRRTAGPPACAEPDLRRNRPLQTGPADGSPPAPGRRRAREPRRRPRRAQTDPGPGPHPSPHRPGRGLRDRQMRRVARPRRRQPPGVRRQLHGPVPGPGGESLGQLP